MKTTQSGNCVKVANLFKVVSTIEVKTSSSCSECRIAEMKAGELLLIWNYKAEGFNLDQARQKLLETVDLRKTLHDAKIKVGKSQPDAPGRFIALYKEKVNSIANFLATFEKSESVRECYHYSYGNYKYQCRTFKLDRTNTPFPVTVCIRWSEDHNWNYYAKSYTGPKSTYSDREVVFNTIRKLGKVTEVFSYPLTTFSGAFMEKAIAAYLGVTKVKCSNNLKAIQLSDIFTVVETNSINRYRLFQRRIGAILWDYAILDTHTRTTYHANEQEKLIPGLRLKLKAKLDIESEAITKQTGYDLGFCETGMCQFCTDNNINFDESYTRQNLRNIVIENREINYRKYSRELHKIGIKIGD